MSNELIILSKKLVYDFADITEDILEHKSIIVLDCDEEGYWIGRKIDESNYDDMVSEYWLSKQNCLSYPWIFVDCLIIDNGAKIDISKGKYHIQNVRNII